MIGDGSLFSLRALNKIILNGLCLIILYLTPNVPLILFVSLWWSIIIINNIKLISKVIKVNSKKLEGFPVKIKIVKQTITIKTNEI